MRAQMPVQPRHRSRSGTKHGEHAVAEAQTTPQKEATHKEDAGLEFGALLQATLDTYENAEPAVTKDPQWKAARQVATHLSAEDVQAIFGKTASGLSVARAVQRCLEDTSLPSGARVFCQHLNAVAKDMPPQRRQELRNYIVAAAVAAAGAAATYVAGNRAGRVEMKEMMEDTTLPVVALLAKNPKAHIFLDKEGRASPHHTSVLVHNSSTGQVEKLTFAKNGVPGDSSFMEDFWRLGRDAALSVAHKAGLKRQSGARPA